MADHNSQQMATVENTREKPRMGEHSGRLRQQLFTINLGETTVEENDTVLIGRLPAGAVFHGGIINNSATLGASTVSIGLASDVAPSDGRFRAAATKTSTTPEVFGRVQADGKGLGERFEGQTDVLLGVGEANLPTSGMIAGAIWYSLD